MAPNLDFIKAIQPIEKRIETWNACGPGLYVYRDTSTMEFEGCNECKTEDSGNEYADMCSPDPDIWLPAQQDANPAKRDLSGSHLWSNIGTVLSGGGKKPNFDMRDIEDTIKSWYISRLNDDEIGNYIERKGYMKDITNLKDRINTFKEDVSGTRGSIIPCVIPNESNDIMAMAGTYTLDIGEKLKNNWKCDESGMFGPRNINFREIRDWEDENISAKSRQRDETSGSIIDEGTTFGDVSTNIMGMELYPPNREFEDCVNELLNEYDDRNDTKIINEIHEIQDITHLQPEHIQFIKRKLEMMLISKSRVSIKQCMLDYVLKDKDPCSTDLSQQMLIIINVLFSTIGFNLHLDDLDNNDIEVRMQLINIINKLGDLIPRALDKIIDISEEIEIDKCHNVTGKTLILKEMNDKLFNPGKKTINIDFGLPNISDLINKDIVSNDEFQRISILGAIGLAIFKFF